MTRRFPVLVADTIDPAKVANRHALNAG